MTVSEISEAGKTIHFTITIEFDTSIYSGTYL